MTKRYAFFAHFNRINMQRGLPTVWTVHFRGRCIPATAITFKVPTVTKFLPEGRQPRATMRGTAHRVIVNQDNMVVVE